MSVFVDGRRSVNICIFQDGHLQMWAPLADWKHEISQPPPRRQRLKSQCGPSVMSTCELLYCHRAVLAILFRSSCRFHGSLHLEKGTSMRMIVVRRCLQRSPHCFPEPVKRTTKTSSQCLSRERRCWRLLSVEEQGRLVGSEVGFELNGRPSRLILLPR